MSPFKWMTLIVVLACTVSSQAAMLQQPGIFASDLQRGTNSQPAFVADTLKVPTIAGVTGMQPVSCECSAPLACPKLRSCLVKRNCGCSDAVGCCDAIGEAAPATADKAPVTLKPTPAADLKPAPEAPESEEQDDTPEAKQEEPSKAAADSDKQEPATESEPKQEAKDKPLAADPIQTPGETTQVAKPSTAKEPAEKQATKQEEKSWSDLLLGL